MNKEGKEKWVNKIDDIVYTPCADFNSGETYFEERKVREVGEGNIVLAHVATLRKQGGEIVRHECKPVDQRGDKRELDYYSRPLEEIVKEHQEQTNWFCNRIMEDEKKFG